MISLEFDTKGSEVIILSINIEIINLLNISDHSISRGMEYDMGTFVD